MAGYFLSVEVRKSMDERASNGSKLKRRDFLAGVAAAPLAPLWTARAAYAQGAPTNPPIDTAIARLAVYPPLGICRVGGGTEWFLAPEVPGLPPVADGRYKDGQQRLKKQVQRFRVYAFNRAGQVLREVTASEARIDWTVHVANTKAAWYGFSNPLDNGPNAPGLPGRRRNQGIVGSQDRASMLVIDPGPKSITGASTNTGGNDPAYAMVGDFWQSLKVKLGHLQTDDRGRLLVFPGDGQSRSAVPNNPIANFSDNDGWHDDWCDGVVQARVQFADRPAMTADNGWVASCGPHYAPDMQPFVSLYDVLTNVAVEAGWIAPPTAPVSFRKHIYPFFRRLAQMEWVTVAHNLSAGWLGIGGFGEAGFIARLADPGPANKPFRDKVFAAFRDPHSDEQQQFKLPYMLGDGINYSDSPLRWLRIPEQQYALLKLWAEGAFASDLGSGTESESLVIDQLPLAEQPEALTRAALEPCSGGAFHPGVELSWPMRHKELYRGPYRIALATNRTPNLIHELGLLLTPELAFRGLRDTPPAIAPQMPGDLTRWMGLPWQCDAFSCQQVVFENDFPNATWWPALLPIDVLPEAYYKALMDPAQPAEQRMKFFANRVAWARGAAGIGYHAEASYSDGISRMIYLWERMGIVVRRPGPTDAGRPPGIPSVLYVEVDRGSMDLSGSGLSKSPPTGPVQGR
ncbi:MAG: CTQ-dependent glycine oxidase GoxA [Alphaproteobacteria bacterium]|nr:CTQ-dependent glycine oxidase GoxA [Alphaproteobacteria bacterium]